MCPTQAPCFSWVQASLAQKTNQVQRPFYMTKPDPDIYTSELYFLSFTTRVSLNTTTAAAASWKRPMLSFLHLKQSDMYTECIHAKWVYECKLLIHAQWPRFAFPWWTWILHKEFCRGLGRRSHHTAAPVIHISLILMTARRGEAAGTHAAETRLFLETTAPANRDGDLIPNVNI